MCQFKMDVIPALPGAYAVQYTSPLAINLAVGQLGNFLLPAGEYIYLGSARGPGGLRARIGRHLNHPPSKQHWHVDRLHDVSIARAYCYLLDTGHSSRIGVQDSTPAIECIWSQALAALPEANIPASGFGASDCRGGCRAHLVAFPRAFPPIGASLEVKKLLARTARAPLSAIICGQAS